MDGECFQHNFDVHAREARLHLRNVTLVQCNAHAGAVIEKLGGAEAMNKYYARGERSDHATMATTCEFKPNLRDALCRS